MVDMKMFRFVALCCVLTALGTGCWSTKPKEGPGAEILNPEAIPEDMPLSARETYGRMVTESEFSVEPVYFGFDSYLVQGSELSKIRSVADFMRRNRNVLLVVEGHCDERGTREYNLSLGEHRALAVRAALINAGVSGSRIQTRSFGEEMPADPRHTESAWRKNRRGNFALYRKR